MNKKKELSPNVILIKEQYPKGTRILLTMQETFI